MALVLSESFVTEIPAGFGSIVNYSGYGFPYTCTATYDSSNQAVNVAVTAGTSWAFYKEYWKIDAVPASENMRAIIEIEFVRTTWYGGVVFTFFSDTNTSPGEWAWKGTNIDTETFPTYEYYCPGSGYIDANPTVRISPTTRKHTIEIGIGKRNAGDNSRYTYIKLDGKVICTGFVSSISSTAVFKPAISSFAGTTKVHSIEVYDDFTVEEQFLSSELSNSMALPFTALEEDSIATSTTLNAGINILSGSLISSDLDYVYNDTVILANKSIYAGNGRIYGFVKIDDSPDIPVRRLVKLYHEDSGALIDTIWSDSVTGAYEFNGLDPNIKFTVIAYDYEHTYNAVCVDNRSPTPW